MTRVLDPAYPRLKHSRTVAFIAHDATREELMALLQEFRHVLQRCKLVATFVTGAACERRLGLPVHVLKSSVKGGDLQVAALVAEGEVDAVLFLRDPFEALRYEPDVTPLLKVCDLYKIPIATNAATARAILRSLHTSILMEESWDDCHSPWNALAPPPDEGGNHADAHSGKPARPADGSYDLSAPAELAQGSSGAARTGAHPQSTGLLQHLLGEVGDD